MFRVVIFRWPDSSDSTSTGESVAAPTGPRFLAARYLRALCRLQAKKQNVQTIHTPATAEKDVGGELCLRGNNLLKPKELPVFPVTTGRRSCQESGTSTTTDFLQEGVTKIVGTVLTLVMLETMPTRSPVSGGNSLDVRCSRG